MTSSYVVLLSNSSKTVYTSNSTSQFRSVLPVALHLKKNDKIAVQALFLDNQFGNIPPPLLYSTDHFLLLDPTLSNVEERFTITAIRATPAQLVQSLNDQVRNKTQCVFKVRPNAQKIDIQLTGCVLLLNQLVETFLLVGTHETFDFRGETYFILNAFHDENRLFRGRKKIDNEPIIPKWVKINIKELTPSLSSTTFQQTAAVIADQNELRRPGFNYTITNKEYFPCHTPTAEISVSLIDENNIPLCLIQGEQTVLQLKIKTMMYESFIMRISSRDCSTLFPGNSSTDFRIQLARPLVSGQKQLEVALSSIYLPTRLHKTVLVRNLWIMLSLGENMDETQIHFTFGDIEEVTAETLFNVFDAAVTTFQNQDFADLTLDASNAFLLHFAQNNVRIRLSPTLAKIFQQASPIITGRIGDVFKLGKPNLLRGYPQILFLCCNFTSHVIVGDTFRNLLKIIPYSQSEHRDKSMRYVSQHLDYLPVSMNEYTLMHFQLITENGNKIQFARENEEVLINLIFREI